MTIEERYFKAKYDADLAAGLYAVYLGGDDSVLNELMAQICPLVRRVYRKTIGPTLHSQQRQMEADALSEAFLILRSKTVPTHPRSFSSFLMTSLQRYYYDLARDYRPRVFNYTKSPDVLPPAGSVKSHKIVETELFYRQLNVLLRDRVRSRIRFIGREQQACWLILDCLLGLSPLDPTIARKRYRIRSPQRIRHLIKYVEILIKAAKLEQEQRSSEDGLDASLWASGRGILRATPDDR